MSKASKLLAVTRDYVLYADRDGEKTTLKSFPASMGLDKVKKEVEKLANKWENEFSDYSGDGLFVSKVLPGMGEGDDLAIIAPDGKRYFFTGDHEWD